MISNLAYIFLSLFLIAQQELFPKDEFGKYTLMEVVDSPGYTREQLYSNADAWVKETFKKPLSSNDSTTAIIKAAGSIIVHNIGSLKKHPDGVVEFELTIELKEARYRYTLTNYTFIPYARDRYAKFVPQNNKSLPLEYEPAAINKANWNGYTKTAHSKSKALIDQLTQAIMINDAQQNKKIKRTDSW